MRRDVVNGEICRIRGSHVTVSQLAALSPRRRQLIKCLMDQVRLELRYLGTSEREVQPVHWPAHSAALHLQAPDSAGAAGLSQPTHRPSFMGPLAYNYFCLHPPSTAALSTLMPMVPTAAHMRCFLRPLAKPPRSTARSLSLASSRGMLESHLLHPGRLAVALLAVLGSRPRCSVTPSIRMRLPAYSSMACS